MVNLLYPYLTPKYGDIDIKYSVRSMFKHMDIGQVWISGDRPQCFAYTEINHVSRRNSKYRYLSSFGNIMAAVSSNGFPDSFLLCNDDFIILDDFRSGFPHLCREEIGKVVNEYPPIKRLKYWQILKKTSAVVGVDFPSFELHCPFPMEKDRVLWTVRKHGLPNGVALRTVYAFDHGISGERCKDRKALLCEDVQRLSRGKWMSMSDGICFSHQFKNIIEPKFKDKSRIEI